MAGGLSFYLGVDQVRGTGAHSIRLHWLAGEFGYDLEPGGLTLKTACGPFSVRVCDANGICQPGSVVAGQEDPPRGWLSRYYGEKRAVASLAVERRAVLPFTLVTILSGSPTAVSVSDDRWRIEYASRALEFGLHDGRVHSISTR